MQGTRRNTARNKQLLAKDIAERALLLSIENVDLDADTIKALRLTCKRTKVAADAKVKKFTMSEKQEPEAVRRSGLLKNIRELIIYLGIYDRGDGVSVAQKLSNSLALLSLAVEICSQSLEVLDVSIQTGLETLLSCAEILVSTTWESLKQLNMPNPMPGLLSAFLANPGSLPALQSLECDRPSADDLESLHNSSVLGNLNNLFVFPYWGDYSSATNTALAKVAAMRSLLQKATNLKDLEMVSRRFEFFDSENLVSLESLYIRTPRISLEMGSVSLAPVLARPWLKLQSLEIGGRDISLQGSDLVRIFEAEDTLPVLKKLAIKCEIFNVDALTCVRRPNLEEFHLIYCRNGQSVKLISKLAQLMKEDRNALANLKTFQFNCMHESLRASARRALSEFLSCPQMASLESLTIVSLGRQEAEILASDIEKYCPKLKHFYLS